MLTPYSLDGRELTCYGLHGTIHVMNYCDAPQCAVTIDDDNHQRIARLTVCIPDVDLEPDEIIVKTWSENKLIIADVYATGWFVDTGKRIETGFTEAQIWKVLPIPEPDPADPKVQAEILRVYAKAIVELGTDLGGYSALDLLADNTPYTLETLIKAMEIAGIKREVEK